MRYLEIYFEISFYYHESPLVPKQGYLTMLIKNMFVFILVDLFRLFEDSHKRVIQQIC